MSEHYPEILQQEKRRAALYAGSAIICLFAPFLLLLIFADDWSYFFGGIALGILLAVIAAKIVKRFFRVNCPRCHTGNLRENYYGGRHSKDVAHTCESCGARFDNGTLQA